MRDLDLWRRLAADDVQPDELAPFGDWTLVRRAPFLGHLMRLCAHGDPSLRAAAVRALAGARGVPALRAIVNALDDSDGNVREAAVHALRMVARDAPYRYAHALFHSEESVRRSALADVPREAGAMATYLRTDPACADLAKTMPWPAAPLPLAVELFQQGALEARELAELVTKLPAHDVRVFASQEVRRSADEVEAIFEKLRPGFAPPGHDILDVVFAAFRDADAQRAAHLVAMLAPRHDAVLGPKQVRALARRAALAAWSCIVAGGKTPALLAMLAALEPRTIEIFAWDGDDLAHATSGIARFGWPIRPTKEQVDRLLRLPAVQRRLEYAVPLAGLHSGGRLRKLAKALGERTVLEMLRDGGDVAWDLICGLPAEQPALELRWLGRIEAIDPARFVALAARALAIHHGKRLEAFVDQIPRKHRGAVFEAYVARADLTEPRVTAVSAAFGNRLDRETLAAIFEALIANSRDAIALALARQVGDKALASALRLVSDAAALRFTELCDGPDPLPRDRELAVAKAFAERGDPTLRAWGERVGTVAEPRVVVPPPPAISRVAIDERQRETIATCSDGDLADAVAPARVGPATGLVEPLGKRVASPNVAACVALYGCVDDLHEVARQLDRFAGTTTSFETQLALETVRSWRGKDVPALANAALFRWEAHTIALATWIAKIGGVLATLKAIDDIAGQRARALLWKGIAEVVVFLRYRDAAAFEREATEELAAFVAERVDGDIGAFAARILVALIESRRVPAAAVRSIFMARVADAAQETREHLARIARLEGLPEPPRVAAAPARDLLAEVRATTDLDRLVAWCRDPRSAVVQEAVLALLVLGDAGLARLASLLDKIESLLAPRPLLASLPLWDDGPAIEQARALAHAGTLPASWQFQLCVALVERGEREHFDRALGAARAPAMDSWFTRDDWEKLVELGEILPCALALADSPHHHAYQPAVTHLVEQWEKSDAIRAALVAFLEIGAERPLFLRRLVARRLAGTYDNMVGLPILVEELVDEGAGSEAAVMAMIPDAALLPVAEAVVDAALFGGHAACSEKRMLEALETVRKDHLWMAGALGPLYSRVLEGASTPLARRAAASLLVGEALSDERIARVAEIFAWGVRRGIELTGRLFRVHLTSQEKDLGHTMLDGNRIFVSALPLLRGEMHGRDIVEGLVLHELGHHAYHRGEAAQALWKQAHAEGIGHLLNLVADEHLERNLRAVDRAYGDRLKRLDAYAFHHASQEIRVETLLASLRANAGRALIAADLEVAFDEASVRIRRGAILTELDRAGHPLARFARALRMGLGNRSRDPLVETALSWCDRSLRTLDMQGLYDLTKRIAALFGGAISIAAVFGGAEGLSDSDRDLDVHGAGVDDEVLQREVERILEPRGGKTGKLGPRDRLCINVNPDEQFDKITHVQRVRGSEAEHRRLVFDVQRHATRLRALLDDLGLRYVPAKARIQGRALDRTRLRALVTRNDPRILTARTPVRSTDLFLGTIVDCSGSMEVRDNLERAKRFAALIAEAVRPLPNVDARFFGFTDSVIYDAGDAHSCDVSALETGGGNNDAAALYHAANVAAASRRRAKVLVMISDGLPTECSVAALRGLVTTLTRRRGMVCAQVAVSPLEEECFPHYLVLDDAALDTAVAKFGRMIGDLARRVLAS